MNTYIFREKFIFSTNRSTIYRALEVLTEVGLITEADLGDGKVYREGSQTAGGSRLKKILLIAGPVMFL